MRIDVHALQSYGLANLNRDDLGHPKEAVFGGVRRARISSQCQKRSARTYTAGSHDHPSSARTRRSHQRVSEELASRGIDGDRARAAGRAAFSAALNKGDLDKDPERQLLFLTAEEITSITDAVAKHLDVVAPADDSHAPSKKAGTDAGKALHKAISGILCDPALRDRDLALYGRMIAAGGIEDRRDAAVSVAHALSTHEVADEVDWFSAADDLAPDDDSGAGAAGHLGELGLNASTFYRYASIDVEQLLSSLGGDTQEATAAAKSFIEGFVRSVPSGKQTATAATAAPSLILIEVREDARSLANAFENPVAADAGALRPSAEQLDAHVQRTRTMWGDDGRVWTGWASALDVDLPTLASDGKPQPVSALIDGAVAGALPNQL